MSRENVETVHRLYAASRRRDREACVREADPDVEIISYLMGVEGSVYRGHAGLRRYIDDLFSAFPDWHAQILHTTDFGYAHQGRERARPRFGAFLLLRQPRRFFLLTRPIDRTPIWSPGPDLKFPSGRASSSSVEAAGYWRTMSQENVETIRRMYERWLQDDARLFDALDPEIELRPDPAADWVGINDIYRGHDGVRSYIAQVYEAFEDYRPEVERLLDAGDKVITLAIEHGRGRGSGAAVEARRTAHVWTMRANKAIRLELYLDRAEALEAVGLRE